VTQTPDSDRDPDAWVVEWEKTHPYPKLKPQLEQEEEAGEGGAAAKKKAEEEAEVNKEEEEIKEKEKKKMKEVVVQEGRGKGLIRLTGQHPLNAEPPAGMLVEAGLITPAPLHYVRNHGPVPRLHWDTHRISVCGMVHSPHFC
jgi:nitrate reductase (NAD(P)H)